MSIKFVNSKIAVQIALLILTFTSGYSQQVEFTATALEQVAVGDQFRLIFSVNDQASGFKAPAIKDFSVLSGPNPSSSSSMQIINNKVTRSVEYSYTYILQAIKEGTFTIGKANVTVDGKVYESNPLTIKVVKGQKQVQPDQQATPSGGDISSKNLFIRASINKNNPYQGEQVIITYKIYTRISISPPRFTKLPSMTGFWKENLLENNTNYKQYRETIDGLEYAVAEIKKDALFAQKSGKLTIEPLEVEVTAQVERKRKRSNDPFDDFFNDSFFGSNYQNIEKTLLSNAITVNVKPLPPITGNKGFDGAVGKYTINSSIDKNKLKANDALTLRFSVSGSGNLKMIEKPNFIFPTDFEVYDPRIVDDIKSGSTGITGKRTFEFLIVPRNHGNYTIKSVPFVYFDINSGSYRTLTTPEYKITVEKGIGNQANANTGVDKEDFQYIGTDIRYIHSGIVKLRPVNTFLFGSPLFWLLLAAPLALFITFLLIWQKELKKRGNVALMRNRKATRIARKRLKAAEHYLKNNNQTAFCNEISNALWGYISDKFNISRSALSIDSVSEALTRKEVKEEIIAKFVSALNNCEFVRFAPGEKSEVMGNLYSEAMAVITQTEQELK